MEIYVLLLIIVGIVLYGVSIFNKIINQKEEVRNGETQISIQLDRRGKIFDSLINTVKKVMDYEKNTLMEVIELREKAKTLKDFNQNETASKELKEVEDQISKIVTSGELTSSLNLTMEAYPELKANENMLQLQEEIVSTENKLSFAKQAYNDSIERYKATIQSVPDVFLVNMFEKQLKEDFEYWNISEEKVQEAEDRKVEF